MDYDKTMIIKADSYYSIGKSHQFCQDYAQADSNQGYACISDGCSGSKDSDFGSRFLVKSFAKNLNSIKDKSEDISSIYLNSLEICEKINISSIALDATFIAAYVINDKIKVFAEGDGVIVVKNKDNTITILDIEYSGNAPYYFRYELDESSKTIWDNEKQQKIIKTTILNDIGDTVSVSECVSKDNYLNLEYDINFINSITVFSDGIKTFRSNELNTNFTLNNIICQLIGYKIPTGEFVKRRLIKFMKDHKDHSFLDDISQASIIIES